MCLLSPNKKENQHTLSWIKVNGPNEPYEKITNMNSNTTIQAFNIIGIAVRTTNQNNQAMQDLGMLWTTFFKENIPAKITNAISSELFSIYTDYESDHTGPYTAILGVKVSDLDSIPEGMVGRTFEGGEYTVFTAKGNMPQAIGEKWMEIWQQGDGLARAFTADFEIHTEKAQQGDQSEVDIYIARK